MLRLYPDTRYARLFSGAHKDSASVISIGKNARSKVAVREDFRKMGLPEKLKGDFPLSIFSQYAAHERKFPYRMDLK